LNVPPNVFAASLPPLAAVSKYGLLIAFGRKAMLRLLPPLLLLVPPLLVLLPLLVLPPQAARKKHYRDNETEAKGVK